MSKLQGNTATLGICNTQSLTIKIVDDDTLQYQYSNEDEIHEANIEYLECEDMKEFVEDTFCPAFKTEGGTIFFIGEFIRDDYGKVK
jgi:hypothetical protein